MMSPEPRAAEAAAAADCTEEIEIAGHIIDSLLLPKVMDEITQMGGRFQVRQVEIGVRRVDPSRARLLVEAPTPELLDEILKSVARHGAVPVHQEDCRLEPADRDGCFPDGFNCTTNVDTEIRVGGEWIPVERQEMDCSITYDPLTRRAACIPMSDVRKGQLIVIGRRGVRMRPVERNVEQHDAFSFMKSAVSSEKPKGITIREVAAEMKRARAGHGRILVVAGPAVIHTGSRELLSRLIRQGYVHVLFAGNALATHDIEQTLYGTSLGISVEKGHAMEEGHEHHLRAINTIRRLGGIRQAVEQGLLTSGVMYECVRNQVPYVLAGSIRDDGPLPDVLVNVLDAQRAMRAYCQDVSLCLMIATTLHSIATGNLLPARTRVVCVDINPATVTKLGDRGSFQTVGLVTDVEPFLRVLVQELETTT